MCLIAEVNWLPRKARVRNRKGRSNFYAKICLEELEEKFWSDGFILSSPVKLWKLKKAN